MRSFFWPDGKDTSVINVFGSSDLEYFNSW